MNAGLLNLPIFLQAAFGCLLVATILALAVIDCREMILPNRLNALLAGGGLAQAVLVGHPNPTDAALGAFCAFAVLSGIATLFRRVRGIDGLGFGDQKFAAAAGLWIGWEGIASMLLIASCSALFFLVVRSASGWSVDTKMRLPFGPFLGIGTVVCWIAAAVTGT